MDLYLLKFPYRKILLPLARKLKFINPDFLGYLATFIAIGTGLCFYYAIQNPKLLITAIILTLIRMTLNTIDGVIAIEQKKDTLVGEIVNALPDRYSDVFYLIGIALSPLCNSLIGILAICSVFLVSYTGMLGKAVGVEWQHQGPLGKVERLILIMIFSLVQYLTMKNGYLQIGFSGIFFTSIEWCMLLYIILGQFTVINRLKGQLRQILFLEWEKKKKYLALKNKILVVYDSMTGNTKKVAERIGKFLHADIKKANTVKNIKAYKIIIIGTPNIRKYPTKLIMNFLETNKKSIQQYAVFVTWGMPIWGPISTGMCFKYFKAAIGKKPVLKFSCRGFHAKYKKYPGRPSEKELKSAEMFSIKIAKKFGIK